MDSFEGGKELHLFACVVPRSEEVEHVPCVPEGRRLLDERRSCPPYSSRSEVVRPAIPAPQTSTFIGRSHRRPRSKPPSPAGRVSRGAAACRHGGGSPDGDPPRKLDRGERRVVGLPPFAGGKEGVSPVRRPPRGVSGFRAELRAASAGSPMARRKGNGPV